MGMGTEYTLLSLHRDKQRQKRINNMNKIPRYLEDSAQQITIDQLLEEQGHSLPFIQKKDN